MKQPIKIFLVFFLLIFSVSGYAQSADTVDFYSSIKNFDLSKLWKSDSILFIEHDDDENGKLILSKPRMIALPEPFGFTGDDYQRLYIHYLSVKKNARNPYQYIVSGKIKVKNNVCKFSGTITIKRSIIYTGDYDVKYKQGVAYCECKFFEDKAQVSNGVITGTLVTGFYRDAPRHIFYDDLDLASDGFANNQFTGIWKSYKNDLVKKCNWGDFRIPDCGDLDIGAGYFSVNDKYLNNGWQSYRNANTGGEDSIKQNKAKDIENKQWWK